MHLVLVYAWNEEAEEHERAKALIEGLLRGPSLTSLFWPVLLSYLRITTMMANGVSTIYTRDRGFRRFDGIRVIDPFA